MLNSHMKKLILLTLTASILFACHKDAATNTNSNKLVRSIWATHHKLDSSGKFGTTIDSFVYDKQNRISKIISHSFDTIFTPTDVYPHADSGTTIITYTGNNSLPSKIYASNGVNILSYNTAGKVSKDSIDGRNVTTYSYSNGLIINFFGSLSDIYSIDSFSIDANDNAVYQLLGGNYYVDSTYHQYYGKIFSTSYSYSNVSNPIYTNPSLSTVYFVLNNHFESKYLPSDMDWISYGKNAEIVHDEKSHYQINVDANNNVQSTINVAYGDVTKWYYY